MSPWQNTTQGDAQTNTHTHFFREAQSLKELLSRLRSLGRNKLSVWCIACATGEEAYSVAMLAHESGITLELLASDINANALCTAQRATYSERRMRHVSMERRRRWFTRTHHAYTVNDELRQLVRFREHNATSLPPKPDSRGNWDAVLCRNMLLYQPTSAVTQTLSNLASVMGPKSLLLLGASEWINTRLLATLPLGYRLGCVRLDTSLAYRRSDGFSARHTAPSSFPVDPKVRISTLLFESSDSEHLIQKFRVNGDQHLDWGNNAEALNCFRAGLQQAPLAADLHLRSALCHLGLGQEEPAIEALRRGLFVEPDLWPASLLLGDILASSDPSNARRFFKQAYEALKRTSNSVERRKSHVHFSLNRNAALEALRIRLSRD